MKNFSLALLVMATVVIGSVSCTKDTDFKTTTSAIGTSDAVPIKLASAAQYQVDTLHRIPVTLVVN